MKINLFCVYKMKNYKNTLFSLLILVLVIIIILLIFHYIRTKEKFESSLLIVRPEGTDLYFANFNNNMLTVSEINHEIKLFRSEKTLRIDGKNLYLDFELINLYENFYIVRLYNNKDLVRYAWEWKPAGGNAYYIYQTIDKKLIYMHVSDNVLKGDEFNKTKFTLE